MIRTFCFLALWLLALPGSSAFAQGVFAGQVVDPQGAVVTGATVTLASEGAPPRSTSSDDQGQFRFADVVEGAYTLQVAAPGFTDSTTAVRVAPIAPACDDHADHCRRGAGRDGAGHGDWNGRDRQDHGAAPRSPAHHRRCDASATGRPGYERPGDGAEERARGLPVHDLRRLRVPTRSAASSTPSSWWTACGRKATASTPS